MAPPGPRASGASSLLPADKGFVEFQPQEIEQGISARFEQQVQRYEDRLALKTRQHVWTYGQLNAAANRVARALLDQRGRAAEPVVLFLEKSGPLLAALLAVLKTGKFYVPVDPAFPARRNQHIVEDSQAEIILTNNQNLAAARQLAQRGQAILNLDEVDENGPSENLHLPISPDANAYLIYTSGSTGWPKGVLQNHRNVLHWIRHQTNLLRLSPLDRLTLLHSCSVVGAVRGTFGALLNGAALLPWDLRRDGWADLTEWLAREQITVLHSVPSIFRCMAAEVKRTSRFPSVRMVLFGAERVLVSDVKAVAKNLSLSLRRM